MFFTALARGRGRFCSTRPANGLVTRPLVRLALLRLWRYGFFAASLAFFLAFFSFVVSFFGGACFLGDLLATGFLPANTSAVRPGEDRQAERPLRWIAIAVYTHGSANIAVFRT